MTDMEKDMEGLNTLPLDDDPDYLFVHYLLNKHTREREERNVQQNKSVLQKKCEDCSSIKTDNS